MASGLQIQYDKNKNMIRVSLEQSICLVLYPKSMLHPAIDQANANAHKTVCHLITVCMFDIYDLRGFDSILSRKIIIMTQFN